MHANLEVWLMRHATAEEALQKPDADRLLNESGHREARHQGAALRARGHGFGLVVSSPLRRCLQTAEHVTHEVGYRGEVVEDARLLFDATVDEMLDIIREQRLRHPDLQHLLLVGHAPSIGHLKGRLLHDAENTAFPKAHVVGFRVEFDEAGEIVRARMLEEMPVPA